MLPNKAKAYLKAVGLKSKNDSIDAAGLARLGAEQHLAEWQPCSEQLRSLKMLTPHHERLQHTKTSLNNLIRSTPRMSPITKHVIPVAQWSGVRWSDLAGH